VGATLGQVPVHVAWISIAPVKGLALQQRESVRLEPYGVRENRRFHLIGEDGRLLNGKQLAPLVRISSEWDEDSARLALGFPDGNVLEGHIELGDTVSTSFYGRRQVEGRLVVGPWSAALSEFVGQPLRLVQPNELGAGIDRAGGGVSILSTASLDALGEAAGVSDPVDGRRFRMLFEVDGIAPHGEDDWAGRRVAIGDAIVRINGLVGRCAVTSQNPDTGVPDLSTLRVIRKYLPIRSTVGRPPIRPTA